MCIHIWPRPIFLTDATEIKCKNSFLTLIKCKHPVLQSAFKSFSYLNGRQCMYCKIQTFYYLLLFENKVEFNECPFYLKISPYIITIAMMLKMTPSKQYTSTFKVFIFNYWYTSNSRKVPGQHVNKPSFLLFHIFRYMRSVTCQQICHCAISRSSLQEE